MDIKIFMAFCSPAGSTRRVAEIVQSRFGLQDVPMHMLDLAKPRDLNAFLDAVKTADPNACLFVGSPVYRNVAVPPVMRFVEALPETAGALAVPFATWGGACSGWHSGNWGVP